MVAASGSTQFGLAGVVDVAVDCCDAGCCVDWGGTVTLTVCCGLGVPADGVGVE